MLFVFAVFAHQATTEQAQPPSRLLGSTPFPLICHQKVNPVSDDYECPHQRTAFSSTLISDITKSERDDKGEDDESCDLLLRHFNGVNSGMFTDAGEVVNVQRTDDPHISNVGHMQFTDLCSLQGYTITHTGERPYKCDVCHKQFMKPSHVKRHMLTHTGERPHKCLSLIHI